jgi:heme oxygenase
VASVAAGERGVGAKGRGGTGRGRGEKGRDFVEALQSVILMDERSRSSR